MTPPTYEELDQEVAKLRVENSYLRIALELADGIINKTRAELTLTKSRGPRPVEHPTMENGK